MVNERSILIQPLEALPSDGGRTMLGIHQSDIILRTAIIAGIADLRANPDILDYVFASLPKDPLTFREYGEQSVADAKAWFLSTEIPVMMNSRVDENKVPCITITLQSSQEDFSSIGDIHYQSAQPGPEKVISYTEKFVPSSYNAATGECVVPVDLEQIFPGMQLLDSRGKRHIIREVWDTSIILDPGLNLDLGHSKIVSTKTSTVALESCAFKESFLVACHAPNEPVYLTYLHSIVSFILLRYKEELIEARGLERTTISSGEIYLNTAFNGQIVFTRPITVYGYVRNYWPKAIRQPIEGITVGLTVGEPQSKSSLVAADTGGGIWGVEETAPANATSIIFGNTYASDATTVTAGLVKLWSQPTGAPTVPVIDATGVLTANGVQASSSGFTVKTQGAGGYILIGGGGGRTIQAFTSAGGAANLDFSSAQTYFTGDMLVGGYVQAPNGNNTLKIRGVATDGASTIAVKIGNSFSLTTPGSKIVSFYSDNLSSERAHIDKDGAIYSRGRKVVANPTADEESDDPGFRETVGYPFPSAIIWWTDGTKTTKLKEKIITRNSNQTPSQVVWKFYVGGVLQRTVTDVISYYTVFETGRTRSVT